jgi:hypothetical protein
MSRHDDVEEMSLQGGNVGVQHVFEPLFGELEGLQYCSSSDDGLYSIVTELTYGSLFLLIYGEPPDVDLLWVFRSLDIVLWGEHTREENPDVTGVVESMWDGERALLVMEGTANLQVLKLLEFDDDVDEWIICHIFHAMSADREEGSALSNDSSGSDSQISEPTLLGERERNVRVPLGLVFQ